MKALHDLNNYLAAYQYPLVPKNIFAIVTNTDAIIANRFTKSPVNLIHTYIESYQRDTYMVFAGYSIFYHTTTTSTLGYFPNHN